MQTGDRPTAIFVAPSAVVLTSRRKSTAKSRCTNNASHEACPHDESGVHNLNSLTVGLSLDVLPSMGRRMDEQHISELRCAAHPQLAAPSRRQSLRTHRRKATNPWGLINCFKALWRPRSAMVSCPDVAVLAASSQRNRYCQSL